LRRQAQDWSDACRVAAALLRNEATKAAERRRAAGEAAGDPAAYRPAKEFLDTQHAPTYKALRALLGKHTWIRRYNPSPQRLVIHAGDWHQLLAALDKCVFEKLDANPEIVAAFVEEARRRQEDIRARKTGK
jgi:hypothetical protein